MTYEEIMLQCNYLYCREKQNIYMEGSENYEWKLGYAVSNVLLWEFQNVLGRIPNNECKRLMDIPVQIDYLRPECIELWKKVG